MVARTTRPAEPAEVDALLDALGHRLRREVIRYFERRAAGTEATVADLAAHVAREESASERERLRAQPYHVHLPKLAADGWLDVDGDHVEYHGLDDARRLLDEVGELLSQ